MSGASIKGYMKNLSTGKVQKFQYNPETFEYSREATYSEIVAPGMSYPDTQYVRGNSRSFPIELFVFDKPNTGKVNSFKSFLEDFLPPETNTDYEKPPAMLFSYGEFIRKCVVESLTLNIEEYDQWGRPSIARFNLSLRQVGL